MFDNETARGHTIAEDTAMPLAIAESCSTPTRAPLDMSEQKMQNKFEQTPFAKGMTTTSDAGNGDNESMLGPEQVTGITNGIGVDSNSLLPFAMVGGHKIQGYWLNTPAPGSLLAQAVVKGKTYVVDGMLFTDLPNSEAKTTAGAGTKPNKRSKCKRNNKNAKMATQGKNNKVKRVRKPKRQTENLKLNIRGKLHCTFGTKQSYIQYVDDEDTKKKLLVAVSKSQSTTHQDAHCIHKL